MEAVIYDFASQRRHANRQARVSLPDALRRIERCCQWLAGQGLGIVGFGFSTLHDPVVFVTAKPAVYSVFSGRSERCKQRQDGALRYEVWEGRDERNHVNVRWEEVIACA